MTARCGRWLAGAAVVGVLAGCGGAAGSGSSAPSSAAPSSADPSSAAPSSPAAAPPAASSPGPVSPAPGSEPGCADYTTTVSTIRGIADALKRGPVLPAGVALFLLGPRTRAAAPDPADPALTAARAELVAAIDDLDAQGRALLPAGGNPARDAVQLDPARILAAAAEIERLCGPG
jgi:hypothetical protein